DLLRAARPVEHGRPTAAVAADDGLAALEYVGIGGGGLRAGSHVLLPGGGCSATEARVSPGVGVIGGRAGPMLSGGERRSGCRSADADQLAPVSWRRSGRADQFVRSSGAIRCRNSACHGSSSGK